MHQTTKELNWLIGKESHLSNENKLLIYKTVIKLIWTYGIHVKAKINVPVPQKNFSVPRRLSALYEGLYTKDLV
jgi:hypothetical protein